MNPQNFEWPIPEGYEACTANGDAVIDLTHFPESTTNKFAGLLHNELDTWDEEGRYFNDGESRLYSYDLKIRPVVTERWLVINSKSGFTTEKEAQDYLNRIENPDRFKILKVTL